MSVSVLHIAQPTEGGVRRYVLAAAKDQMDRGWNVQVACPEGGSLVTDLAAVGIRSLEWNATRAPNASVPAETAALRELVARIRPDVVHLHSSKAGLAGRLAIRGHVPTLFQPHCWSWLAVGGVTAALALRWERWAARWTNVVVCVGSAEAEIGRTAGVSAPMAVVRNGVDLVRHRPPSDDTRRHARAALGIGPAVPLVVCVGRVCRQKGQDVLLDAWPAVRLRYPAAELLLVGECDGAPDPPPGARFAGPLDDVRIAYAAADVIVIPSRWEGLSLTALEAVASGCTIVASAVPGLSEVLDGIAHLVPPSDVPRLADALVQWIAGPTPTTAGRRAAAGRARDFDERLTFRALADLTLGAAAGRGHLIPKSSA